MMRRRMLKKMMLKEKKERITTRKPLRISRLLHIKFSAKIKATMTTQVLCKK
jgi:hypothetical protein